MKFSIQSPRFFAITVSAHIICHILHESQIRGPFEKFVDWRKCAAVMQREAATLMPSCSGGGKVVVV
jgi:hypothetical protein